MDGTFIYNKPVSGKNFIGRRADQTLLSNLLLQGENVVIYEPSKTGVSSLLQQTFLNMRISGKSFVSASISLLGIRDMDSFLTNIGSSLLRAFATTPDEYAALVQQCLPDTHFVFDPVRYSSEDAVLSLNWNTDENDIRSILGLPWRLSAVSGKKLFMIIEEFQNISGMDGWEKLLKIFEDVIRNSRREMCSYVFVGSRVNGMKEIFEHRVFFHRQVNRVKLSSLEPREITDFVVKGFLTSGKVIDRDTMMNVCKRFRCNIWYINHFASICDHLTKGYITDATLLDALDMLLSIHEPRFKDITGDLTGFQLSLLRATLEGCKRFSSAEVIEHYALNSSANVRRLKDALCKKEIISFTENDDPEVIDPLFEYWAKTKLFKIKE